MPTDLARGPWTPEALHGGPVAALVARSVERCEPAEEMQVARLTVELLRPVPVAPLEVQTTLARPGRKVQLIDVRVSSGDLDLAWGRALRIRTADPRGGVSAELADLTATSSPTPEAPPGPEQWRPTGPLVGGYDAFHNTGAELRFVRGRFDGPGPATVWVRLRVPVAEGEEPSPLQRVAAAADFGNGVSSVLDFNSWVFINPDVTVTLERLPSGEWICLDATTRLGTPGIGVAECALWDQQGPIGHSVQSLLIEPR